MTYNLNLILLKMREKTFAVNKSAKFHYVCKYGNKYKKGYFFSSLKVDIIKNITEAKIKNLPQVVS